MRYVRIALALLVAALAVFAGLAWLQPDHFRVERRATIAAPVERVFAQVNDLRAFQAFSPWARKDPGATRTFDGPPSGAGASFAWAGNDEVGKGRMTIVESVPNQRIRIRLEFLEPFASTASSEFVFDPIRDGTVVTWSVEGENDFVAKAVGLVLDVDGMIGADFETGLAGLAALVEAPSR